MDSSKLDASAVVLKTLEGYPKDHGDGVLVESVVTGCAADGELFPGDLIRAWIPGVSELATFRVETDAAKVSFFGSNHAISPVLRDHSHPFTGDVVKRSSFSCTRRLLPPRRLSLEPDTTDGRGNGEQQSYRKLHPDRLQVLSMVLPSPSIRKIDSFNAIYRRGG